MPKKSIPVYHRQEKRDAKQVSSRDLSRKELLKYIFEDFFRGFYIIGAIFLNGLILTEIYYAGPAIHRMNFLTYSGLDGSLLDYYLIAVLIIFEISVTVLEIEGFAKIWMKDRRKDA